MSNNSFEAVNLNTVSLLARSATTGTHNNMRSRPPSSSHPYNFQRTTALSNPDSGAVPLEISRSRLALLRARRFRRADVGEYEQAADQVNQSYGRASGSRHPTYGEERAREVMEQEEDWDMPISEEESDDAWAETWAEEERDRGIALYFPHVEFPDSAADRLGITQREAWPGLVATRPLNPNPSTSTSPPTSSSTLSHHSDFYSSSSSSTSPSSFLQPGIQFSGQQFFHPSSSRSSRSRSSSPNLSRPSDPLRPSLLASQAALETLGRPLLSQSMSVVTEGMSVSQLAEQVNAFQVQTELLRNQTLMLQEARRITMAYLEGAREEDKAKDSRCKDERWDVKVIINSYSHSEQAITGLMIASGVPNCANPITTYFTGSILNPSSPAHWREWRTPEIKWWVKLSPFKKCTKVEMIKRRGDREWLERKLRGFVIMIWKEKAFVNVTPAESTLSISGVYIVAMRRSDGMVEGVYFDPTTFPTQKILLYPGQPGGAYTSAGYDFA